MTNINGILHEREKTHGKFADSSNISQSLKQIAQMSLNWEKMNDAQREAFDQSANKWGRILAGDPHLRDHWDDLAGYSTLGSRHSGMSLTNVERDLVAVVKESVAGLPKVTAIVP
jgi:hypothetical protein